MADARLDAYANWLVQNQDKQGTPEFETVASAYKQLRGSESKPPPDPYAGKSLDDLKHMYRGSNLVDANDQTRSKIMDAYVRKEAQQGGFGLALDDVGRQLAKGVPIVGGLLDEANAATSSLLGGNYDETLDYNRARDRYREEANPETSFATQIAGGVGGTLAGMRALGVPYAAASATPITTRMLAGAGVGATIGGADMFGRGEGGVENRATNAAIGAGLGGIVGAGAPVVAEGLTAGAQRVANWLTSDAMLKRLGISREAANVLIRQLGADDTLSQKGAQRIADAGPEGMLADAGPAASNLLDTSLERSGPGATQARQAIEARARQSAGDMAGALDETLGPPVGVETRQAGIRLGSADARRSAYGTAETAEIDFSTPAGKKLAEDMKAIPQWALDEARQEIALRRETPTLVRILDRATRALNSAAQRGERGGALGGNTPLGSAAGSLASDIRQSLREAVPEYGVALDTAADPIRRVQATEFGATVLNPQTTREQVAMELRGMTAPERKAVMEGMRDQVDEVMANVRKMASDPNTEARQLREGLGRLSSKAAREKIEIVIGRDKANALYGTLGRAMRSLELRASVARNSRTFGRQATDAQVKAQIEPGVLGLALEGHPALAARKAIQNLTRMTPERRLEAEDRLYGEIAKALTEVRGTRAEGYLNTLIKAVRSRATNTSAAKAAGTLGTDALVGATVVPADRNLRISPRN